MAGDCEGSAGGGCKFRGLPATGLLAVAGLSGVLTGGSEGAVALASLASFLSDCASGLSLVEVMELEAFSWIASSGFVAGGCAAQDRKVSSQTSCMARHLQLFMQITLIRDPLLSVLSDLYTTRWKDKDHLDGLRSFISTITLHQEDAFDFLAAELLAFGLFISIVLFPLGFLTFRGL